MKNVISSVPPEIRIEGRPLWAEVHTAALEANLLAIRRHLDSSVTPQQLLDGQAAKLNSNKRVRILAVVKGNGYGHGAAGAAKAFARAGADWFGVTCSSEGIELREAGIRKPVLLLTGFWEGEEQRLIECKLTPAVTDFSQLAPLEKAARRAAQNLRKPLKFHLKIDTGMNRLGVSPDSIERLAHILSDCRHLQLSGTFTHLASSGDFTSTQTCEQFRVFVDTLDRMRNSKIDPGLVHLANSAAVIARPEMWMDMVRPGTVLYGYHQNFKPTQLRSKAAEKVHLSPALSFRTRIVAIKDVPEGGRIGYDGSYLASQPMRIAILAAGFADGLPRGMSNRGRVLVNGKFASIVGIVSMDLATVNVTDVPDARVGDVATIYGPASGGPESSCSEIARQDASEVAQQLGTRTSHVLCMLGKRVPRIYVR